MALIRIIATSPLLWLAFVLSAIGVEAAGAAAAAWVAVARGGAFNTGISAAFALPFSRIKSGHRHRKHSLSAVAASPVLLQQVQEAIDWTKSASAGASNINAAYEATSRWDALLLNRRKSGNDDTLVVDDTLDQLSPKILAMMHAMHASTLVRIGQDERALDSYDQAMAWYDKDHMKSSSTTGSMNHGNDAIATGQTQALLGKARSLQRLLRYARAKEVFLQVASRVQNDDNSQSAGVAAVGAATCALRLGHNVEAFDILQDFETQSTMRLPTGSGTSRSSASLDLESPLGLLSALRYTRSVSHMIEGENEASFPDWHLSDVSPTTAVMSPVHKWILSTRASRRHDSTIMTSALKRPASAFVDYCKVNVGPLDDYRLRHLDDKVLLHTLLSNTSDTSSSNTGTLPHFTQKTTTTNQFWPLGFILSAANTSLLVDSVVNKDGEEDTSISLPLWICKRRAGYGSHGNTIVRASMERVVAAAAATSQLCKEEDDTSILTQRMIESPLLLDGRTFSMRVYVVLCGTAATAATKEPDVEPIVYIAKEGLIKLAAVPWREDDPTAAQSSDTTAHTAWNDIDPRMYLTNSGREANMSQTNFAYLRRHVSEAAFVEIWGSIVSAVDTVMTLYHSQIVIANAGSSADTACSMLGLPKIMGFDFVVDQSHQAWLVEVNRFPGLEPRGSTGSSDKGSNDDSLVKRQIVRDAWLVAAATSDGYTHETTMTDVMKWWLEQCGTKDGIWSWLKDDFADLGCLDKNAIMLKKL